MNLTHHCCNCNRIMLVSGEWLPELIIKIIGVKQSHGYCPKCRDKMLADIRQRKTMRMAA